MSELDQNNTELSSVFKSHCSDKEVMQLGEFIRLCHDSGLMNDGIFGLKDVEEIFELNKSNLTIGLTIDKFEEAIDNIALRKGMHTDTVKMKFIKLTQTNNSSYNKTKLQEDIDIKNDYNKNLKVEEKNVN